MLLAKKTTTTDLRRALPAAVNALAELCYPEDSDWQQCEEISLFSNGLCSCATNATTQRANEETTKWYCGTACPQTAQDVNERIPSQPQQEE